jgi:hypothetical protein
VKKLYFEEFVFLIGLSREREIRKGKWGYCSDCFVKTLKKNSILFEGVFPKWVILELEKRSNLCECSKCFNNLWEYSEGDFIVYFSKHWKESIFFGKSETIRKLTLMRLWFYLFYQFMTKIYHDEIINDFMIIKPSMTSITLKLKKFNKIIIFFRFMNLKEK